MHRFLRCALCVSGFVALILLGFATDVPALAAAARVTHGPVVGAVTSHSAQVFARTNTAARVKIRYSRLASLQNSKMSGGRDTVKGSDFTAHVVLTNLKPNTTYYFDILVNDVSQLTSPFPQFKTFPPEGESKAFKFVILNDFGTNGSSKPPLPTPVKTFARADAEAPDFVLIGGDFFHAHADRLAKKRRLFRHNYELNSPAAPMDDFVNRILRKYPLAHMWDDHDIGTNNANKFYPFKAEARRALLEYFPVYPLGAGGDYQSFNFGQAQFWLLDSRSFRDVQTDPDGPAKSMLDGDNLGAAGQLEWLLNGLEASTARWKFIVSPVPFNASLIKNDSWVAYNFERQAIIDFIRTKNISGVVILSGDLHFGGMDDGTYSAFPEMLVPGPNLKTCATTHEPGQWSHGKYVRKNSSRLPCNGYGVVTVLTNPDRVMLEVKNAGGVAKLQMMVD